MKKSDWRDTYDRLLPFFQDAARTYYNEGDTERGFKFWAVSEVLTDTDLSDDEIKDALRLDAGGDLSLDACFEDAEASTLVLVQSKFHADAVAVGNGEIGKFLGCLDRVLNPKVVVESKNPLIAEAHRAVREAISKGWTLRFVFVTSGYLSPEGKVFAEENVEVAQFVDGVKIQRELDVYDLERLRQLYESHLTPGRFSTDVTLNIAKKERVS